MAGIPTDNKYRYTIHYVVLHFVSFHQIKIYCKTYRNKNDKISDNLGKIDLSIYSCRQNSL